MMNVALIFLKLLALRPAALLKRTWERARHEARGARVSSTAQLRCEPGCALELSSGTLIGHGCILFSTSEPGGREGTLSIGTGTAINEYCNIRASGAAVVVGSNCMLAQFVSVIATNHGTRLGQPMIGQDYDATRRGVMIGNDVWIGANAVLLPGITVHDGAVIAAGAVVNRDVPAGEIWGGVPARRISERKA